MKRYFLILLFVSSTFLPFAAFSQDAGDELTADEQRLKAIVLEFAEAYAKVGETKDIKGVVKYIHPKVSATLVSSNVNENVKVTNSDYASFRRYLAMITRAENVKIDYELADLLHIQSRGTIGVVAYVVEYVNKKNGEVWAKGSETVTLTFKKFDEEWKIIHYTIVGIEDEKNRGGCRCEIFEGNKNDYVVKTTVPAGRSYETTLNNFEFRSAPRNAQFVIVKDKKYIWEADGELWRTDAAGEQTDKLVRAVEHTEVILSILRQDLFAENCAKIKIKE